MCGCLLAPILAFPLMWLWNAVLPDLFALPIITYWQSVFLTMLVAFVGMFFGGSGSRS